MDNEILSTNFLKIFASFVKELSSSFPEYESVIYENYNSVIDSTDFSLQDNEPMKEFMDRIDKSSELIKSKNEKLFMNDEVLLTGVSFKNIWSSKINEKTKDSIWKYLQAFSLLNLSYRANDELKQTLESLSSGEKNLNTKDKELIKELKNIKELGEDIKKENVSEKEEKEDKDNSEPNPLEDMIKNSQIGKIAEEVSNSINMDEMLGDLNDDSDMGEVFSKLVSGGGIGKIFEGINKVVTEKVDDNELSKDDLQKEAMEMCENMGQNLFSQMGNMMGNSGDQNPMEMFTKMAQQMHPQRVNQMHNEMKPSSNPTRDRLQRKLADKNKN